MNSNERWLTVILTHPSDVAVAELRRQHPVLTRSGDGFEMALGGDARAEEVLATCAALRLAVAGTWVQTRMAGRPGLRRSGVKRQVFSGSDRT